uniref:hypothetical protein n=1 Tax=Halomonas sp. TaxID=1486246 RepID=UPI00261E35E0|nr:hypothetical protein [Halomonas sp.]
MAIEDTVVRRIEELLDESSQLRRGNEYGQASSIQHAEKCKGWIAAASNIVELLVPDANSGYRRVADRIREHDYGYVIPQGVGEMSEVLTNLLRDAQAGLVASVADNARAEIFDDFLDHAKLYLKQGRKNEAGVIAGVVFEDSLRRVCRKSGIDENGQKLDALISELAKSGYLSATKAKRARVSADVRTKATHAQWDEFDESDVRTTIEFATDFITNHLEG